MTLIKIDHQEVIRRIKLFYSQDISLKDINVRKHHGALHSAGIRRFGSWKLAIEAAGLDYAIINKRRTWNKEKIIAEIQRLVSDGVRLNGRNIRLNYTYLYNISFNYFGSWRAAVEASGISYQAHSKTFSTKHWLRKLTSVETKKIATDSLKLTQTRRSPGNGK